VARAFVIGNAAMDEFFRVERLPERGASILGRRGVPGLGGKGANQAIVLARSGVETVLIAAIGQDSHGARIRALLKTEPLTADLVELAETPTDISVVLAGNDGANAIITSNACAQGLSVRECTRSLGSAGPEDVALFQGNLLHEIAAELMDLCRRRNVRVFFNPSPVAPDHARLIGKADTVFVNEVEAAGLTGGAGGHDAIAQILETGAGEVVLTMGRRGALLGSGEGTVHVAARDVDVVDPTGAGDSFEAAAVASALLRGCALDRKALEHAAAVAAVTVVREGAARAFPTSAELHAIMLGKVS